ncbi:MAG: copper amine oxidase N-terminal domain-containing protein [Clostridiales bacterium]|nr:copper amine oxidase N-terminal domain-containing protein [Clostridiales bacterium]
MKNNVFKKITIILAVVFSMLMCVSALADDPVYVTINGNAVTYATTDAQPMIYNSRAMVPIRTTAEALGLTVGWDKDTETATFTNADGSRVIKHTMRSNIIYVNGTPTSFDTASIVVSNRILMPIRMLGEAMGAEVSWDNPSRTVNITTASETPEIEYAEFVEDTVTYGDETTVVVVTNLYTTAVRLYDQTGAETVKEATTYSDNGDGSRTFSIDFTPSAEGERTYYLYAGDGTSYYSGYAEVTLTIEEDDSADDDSSDDGLNEYIYKVTLDSTKVEKGDYVEFTVVTTDDVTRIRVESSYGSKYTTLSDYTETSSKRTFEGKLSVTSTGSLHLYFYVYTTDLDSYTDDYRVVDFRGISDDDDDDEEDQELTIIDIIPGMGVTTKKEETKLYIFTSTDIDYVEVYDEDDERVAYSNYTYDELATTNVFLLTWTETSSGTNKYTVTAYNEDDDEVSETIRISCESNPGSTEPFVISIEPKTDNIETGETTTFIAKCSTGTDYIVIKDENGKTLYSTEGSSSTAGSSYIKFTCKVDISSVNEYYTIYAYNEDGDVDARTFYVYGIDNADPEITDVNYDASIDEGDEVEVTVYTTTTVAKVWIEDEDDDNVTNKLKTPTKSTSSQYTWVFTFEPDDSGRRTYTIYAENEDGDDYDTETIKIKVN